VFDTLNNLSDINDLIDAIRESDVLEYKRGSVRFSDQAATHNAPPVTPTVPILDDPRGKTAPLRLVDRACGEPE
jgi:hypothetical protein